MMTMNAKPLRCIRCQAPITMKERDRVVECGSCHTHLHIEGGDLAPLTVSVTDFTRQEGLPRFFIPFWVIEADIRITEEQVRGARVSRFVRGRDRMEGKQRFFICAADLPPGVAAWWNATLNGAKPPVSPGGGAIGTVPRIPARLPMADARNEAEFLFLRHELDASGTLQSIDYEFLVDGVTLAYLPFYQDGGKYVSGLAQFRDLVPPDPAAGNDREPSLTARAGVLSSVSSGGLSGLSRSRVALLALVGIIIVIIAIAILLSGFHPVATLLLITGLGNNQGPETMAVTPTVSFTVSPTDAVPRGTEVYVQVQKVPPHNLITALFAGGPGHRVIRSCEVILTTSGGERFMVPLTPLINSQITLQGTAGDDRIEVYVTQMSGIRYRIVDTVLEPYQTRPQGGST